jgi:hypothetical protein
MNFIETPTPVLEENGKMTENQLNIEVAFVTELSGIKVLVLVSSGILLLNAFPLFLASKPGHQYQLRCIADMKKRHQNQSFAAVTVHMTCPEDILPRMHPGGGIISDWCLHVFHIFLDVDEERKFMGLIHPDTGYHH